MSKNNAQKWFNLYENSTYQTKLKNFLLKTDGIFNNYEKMLVDEKKIISYEYYEIWKSSVKIASSFLCDNLIPAKEDKDVVTFLINSDVFKNGEDVFLLYRGMCNIKKNNLILPKKYYSNKYINIFERFGHFFAERTGMEKNYAMDF